MEGADGAPTVCAPGKGAFQAADKAHELPIHYSSNHKKFGKYGPGGSRRKGGKGKSKARQEYASRNAL